MRTLSAPSLLISQAPSLTKLMNLFSFGLKVFSLPNKCFDSITEILSEPGIDKNLILNLKCTALPSLEWGIPSIDTKAIPKSYKVCIKPTTLSESNYSQLANAEGKPGIYILYSKPENGVSVNATPLRRIFCRPKPFCKL